MILYIKTVRLGTLKNDASGEITKISKITHFLKSIAEDEDSLIYFLHYRS